MSQRPPIEDVPELHDLRPNGDGLWLLYPLLVFAGAGIVYLAVLGCAR